MATEQETQLFNEAPSEFVTLEQKVYRAIELLKNARDAKAVAERDLVRVRAELEQRDEEMETLKADNIALRREREEVRARLDKLVQQMDAVLSAAE